MKTVSATAAQREPVVIRRRNRDVAVVVSVEEYDRIRGVNNAELTRIMDRIGVKAAKRGMTKEILADMM